MNLPMIVWSLLVAIIAAVTVLKILRTVGRSTHRHLRHHVITIGSERDELFVAGDHIDPEQDYAEPYNL